MLWLFMPRVELPMEDIATFGITAAALMMRSRLLVPV
jgi:hypothetical protein